MGQKRQFRGIIENAGGGGAFVVVPFDVEQAFGKKRVKVKATIDGVAYRGSLVRMGTPHHMLIVLKEIREKIGKSFGDEVAIEVEEDLEPRQIEIPAELQQAFASQPDAFAFFNQLAYSHQREYVRWINEAKQDETRQKRILKTIELLNQGKREH
jgi:hypothetical protein